MLPSVEVSLTALLRTLLIALTSLTLTCDLDFHLTLRAVVRPIHTHTHTHTYHLTALFPGLPG